MELDQPTSEFKPPNDRRPHMPEPPPVWLLAVEDVAASCPPGRHVELDAFYVGLLRMEREPSDAGQIVYRAHNYRLRLKVIDPPILRADFRPIGIAVPSLPAVQKQLVDDEIEFVWQPGLFAGHDQLLVRDPAGNWVMVAEHHEIR